MKKENYIAKEALRELENRNRLITVWLVVLVFLIICCFIVYKNHSKKQNTEEMQRILEVKTEAAYSFARKINTEEAYLLFLKEYRDSLYNDSIRLLLNKIEEKKDTSSYTSDSTNLKVK